MSFSPSEETYKELVKEIEELTSKQAKSALLYTVGYMIGSLETGRDGYCAFGEGLQDGIITYKYLE